MQHDHSQQRQVPHAQRLERAELTNILDREQVERLSDDCCSNGKSQQHRDPKIDWNAGLLHVVVDSLPFELIDHLRLKARLLLDPPANFGRIGLRIGLSQDERHHFPLLRHELNRLTVSRIDDWKCLKGPTCFANSHDDGPTIVHLKRPPQSEWILRPQLLRTAAIDDHRVRLPKILQSPGEDFLRRADQRPVVYSNENRLLITAVRQPRPAKPLVQFHGPFDPRYAADAVQLVLAHRLDVVDELNVGVHYPQVRSLNIFDLAGRQPHQSAKYRRLLRNEQGREPHP